MNNTNWGNVIEDNSFGTHEFLELCSLLNCEPYISANVGSGTVEEMSKWIEYLNFDGQSPMANLRNENGRSKPWNVSFWGIGNEAWGCGGRMTPEYYANEYRRYATYTKDYANATKYFTQLKAMASQQENKLEAMRGLLRCQFKTEQWQQAAPNAQELLNEKGIANDDRILANMVLAKNQQQQELYAPAAESYKTVIAAGRSEYAAESAFRIAEMLLKQHRLPEAEKAAFEVIKKWGSYEHWVAKSYLLLGDLYFEQKDLFNAEATFKSVVDNAGSVAIKQEAQLKLDLVLGEKNKTNKIEQQ